MHMLSWGVFSLYIDVYRYVLSGCGGFCRRAGAQSRLMTSPMTSTGPGVRLRRMQALQGVWGALSEVPCSGQQLQVEPQEQQGLGRVPTMSQH
jgi:hypothetical protein